MAKQATAFAHGTPAPAEEGITKCREGFRCVSRVRRFGEGHPSGSDVSASPTIKDPSEKAYEWNCPANGVWAGHEFESGTEPGTCIDEKDCICISRGSSNHVTYLVNGDEKMTGKFLVQTRDKDVAVKEEEITVIPHYRMREVPATFDFTMSTTDMGKVNHLPKQVWVARFQDVAPKMQSTLDQLQKELLDEYEDKIHERNFSCEMFPPAYVQAMQTRIRRFQILTGDCAQMRDTAARLARTPEEEKFAGEFKEMKLRCYKNQSPKGLEDTCQQLNCYRGQEDGELRAALQDFKAKLDRCRPEEDVPDEAGFAPSQEEVAATRRQPQGQGLELKGAALGGAALLAASLPRCRGAARVPCSRSGGAAKRSGHFL